MRAGSEISENFLLVKIQLYGMTLEFGYQLAKYF